MSFVLDPLPQLVGNGHEGVWSAARLSTQLSAAKVKWVHAQEAGLTALSTFNHHQCPSQDSFQFSLLLLKEGFAVLLIKTIRHLHLLYEGSEMNSVSSHRMKAYKDLN